MSYCCVGFKRIQVSQDERFFNKREGNFAVRINELHAKVVVRLEKRRWHGRSIGLFATPDGLIDGRCPELDQKVEVINRALGFDV